MTKKCSEPTCQDDATHGTRFGPMCLDHAVSYDLYVSDGKKKSGQYGVESEQDGNIQMDMFDVDMDGSK